MIEIKLHNDGDFNIEKFNEMYFYTIPNCYKENKNGYGLQLNNYSKEKEIKDLCFEIYESVKKLNGLLI